MRTVHCSGHGGGVCLGGIPHGPWGRHPPDPEADTILELEADTPQNRITDRCKNITFPQVVLRTVKKLS